MALGRHLVRELGLGESTDTLGRWLAHELAELIDRAEHAPSEVARRRARREAVRITLALWRRRERLPARAYPLASFRQVLRTISLFTEDDRRAWWGFSPGDSLPGAIFRAFARLMPLLLLLKLASPRVAPSTDGPAFDALIPEEQALLQAISAWFDALKPEAEEQPGGEVVSIEVDQEGAAGEPRADNDRDAPRADDSPRSESELEPRAVRAAALRCVDELIAHLDALRNALRSNGPSPVAPNVSGEPPE